MTRTPSSTRSSAAVRGFSFGSEMLPDTRHPVEGRLAKYQEIGAVLRQRYDGHFLNLLAEADGWLFRDDGRGVIQSLVEQFPISYGDWPFAKLANVIARGLH